MFQKTTLTNQRAFYLKPLMFTMAAFCLSTANYAQEFMNGNLSTGAISKSGVAAPAGYTWSELQNDAAVTTLSNGSLGFGAAISANLTVADNFTVPAGESWVISKLAFFAYKTGSAATPSPFNNLRFIIHNANPMLGTTTVLHGDLTTNVYGNSIDALMYRTVNSLYPTATTPGTTRKIWKIESTAMNLTLPAGTYWLEWQVGDTAASGSFSPPSTVVDARTQPGYNAIQKSAEGVWAALLDNGSPTGVATVAVDMPFAITRTIVLGVEESKFNTVSVYPNPVKDVLNFDLKNNIQNITSLELYDIKGSLIAVQAVESGVDAQMNVSRLNQGVYLVKFLDNTGKYVGVKKIVKD